MSSKSPRNHAFAAILPSLLTLAVFLAIARPVSSYYPPVPAVSIRAAESIAVEWGPEPGTFIVSLSFRVDFPLTVGYTVSGTARPGSDYRELSESVTIPKGARNASISVIPLDDVAQEDEETVIVELQAGPDYEVGSPASAVVTIIDDDVSIRISDNSIGNPWLYLWDPVSGKLFQGPNPTAEAVAFFDIDRPRGEGRIHAGANTTGPILFTVEFRSGRIWAGPNPTAPLLYTLEPLRTDRGPYVRVRLGDSKGPPIYTINDDDFYLGPRVSGPLVSHGSRPFWGPIQFLLPLLADNLIP